MIKHKLNFIILIVAGLMIAACSSSPAAEEPAVMVESEEKPSTEETMIEQVEPAQEEAAEEDMPAEEQYPDWYSAELTNVNTGEVFRITDNPGKVYLVETLATWCSNCLKQQQEVKRFHELLGERDDFESLGINIDPNENTTLLTDYVQDNGFDWKYVVASPEMINEISALYGPQFLNPPSTPMLIIDRQGNAHPLNFGIKSAEELLDAVSAYL